MRSGPTVRGRGVCVHITNVLRGVALLALVCASGTWAGAAENDPPVLTEGSPWQYWPVWRTGVYRTADGGIEDNWRWTRHITPTPAPPGGWMSADFDDTDWLRTQGPFFEGTRGPEEHLGHGQEEPTTIANICLRGRFMVHDPQAVKDLRLTLAYRGGAVVYLNGREVARQHLPEGDIDVHTLAEDYPVEAARPDPRWAPETAPEATDRRIRRMRDVSIPVNALRRGVNVLAIRLHRAPYAPEAMEKHSRLDAWATVGLHKLCLSAAPAGAVESNSGHPPHTQVWTASPTAEVGSQVSWPDPREPGDGVEPIRLIVPRNGVASGQAVVSATRPLVSVSARVPEAVGPGGATIGADAWRVRYAATTTPQANFSAPRFDALLDEAPAGQSIQPVWVTVRVARDASPGQYQTTLRIDADGLNAPVDVPVELTVVDWTLPDPAEFSSFVSLNHSPQSVARQYGVEMWSQRHLELLAASMKLMAELGNNTLFVEVIHPTFFANEHGVIVFREDNGRMEPDFRYFDRLLDLYAEHIGEPKKLILYVWEPYLKPRRDEPPETVTLSRLSEDGTLSHFEHPMYGREGSEPLWRDVMEGVRQRMRDRGWSEHNVVLGVGSDRRPSEQTVEFFRRVAPWAKWAVFTHGRGDPGIRNDRLTFGGMEVGYLEHPYAHGRAGRRSDTILGGWKNLDANVHKVYCGRQYLTEYGPLHNYRVYGDMSVAGSSNGFGRVGVDIWPVRKDEDDQPRRAVHGSGGWGNLYRHNPRSIAYPGANGAIGSIRFELLREGLQEAEARIFIEKALTDEETADLLGEDIARRYESLSRERLAYRHAGGELHLGPGWMDRMEALYRLAAEIERMPGEDESSRQGTE
ncbi:MAG: glycoside hydrolase domain-containing protein [Phycisphaerae bacterium]